MVSELDRDRFREQAEYEIERRFGFFNPDIRPMKLLREALVGSSVARCEATMNDVPHYDREASELIGHIHWLLAKQLLPGVTNSDVNPDLPDSRMWPNFVPVELFTAMVAAGLTPEEREEVLKVRNKLDQYDWLP